jgi:hypothetical protein
MSDRIVIGQIQLEHRTIEVTAESEGTTATAWIERLVPAPRLALGYVTELDSPAPRLCLYRAEWTLELRDGLKEAIAQVWADAIASYAIQSRETNTALIPIGETEIDAMTVDFVWTSISDHIQVRFRHLQPNVIGHVVFGPRKSPALVPNAHHRAWAEEPDHAQAILRVASGLHQRRHEITSTVDPGA